MSAHSSDEKAPRDQVDVGEQKVLKVENVDYALALATGPQLKATDPRSLQLFAILLVAYLGSLSNGFDGQGMITGTCALPLLTPSPSVMSAVNGMSYVACFQRKVRASLMKSRQYTEYFGINVAEGGGVGTTTAIIFGIVSICSSLHFHAKRFFSTRLVKAYTQCIPTIILTNPPGSIAGVFIAGPLADNLGRRGGMVSSPSHYIEPERRLISIP